MTRLAVRGDEAIRLQLERRLHHATVEPFPPDDALPGDCDAAVLLESHADDAALVRRCLQAGRHVLLVASPWLTGAVLDELEVEAAQSGAHLVIHNPDRFLPSRQLIRQQLDSGRLGDPGLIRCHLWEHASAPGDETGNDETGNDETGYPQSPRMNHSGPLFVGEGYTGTEGRRSGEGDPAVAAPLARALDVALWLMGTLPNLVYALTPANAAAGSPGGVGPSAPTGRSMQVHLGFPSGGMALIDYVDSLPPGDGYQSLSVIGSSGAAYADDHQNVQLVYGGGHPGAVPTGEGTRALVALVQEFAARLAHSPLPLGPDGPAGVQDWRSAMRVAAAAQRSAAERQAVPLAVPSGDR